MVEAFLSTKTTSSQSLRASDTTRLDEKATVLIVDDESFIRDLLSRWLEDQGYRCVAAADVDEALDCLQRLEIHVITTDIDMPGRTGIDLLEQVHASDPDLGVILLTGVGTTKTAIKALHHGAWGYLWKPVERDEFLFQIKSSLERRHLILENRGYTERLEEKIREQVSVIQSAYEETIQRLVTASRYRDEETGAHIRRTGLYSAIMAKALGWPRDRVQQISMAAPMHDIGKIGIPDAILQKPGPLTPQEFEIMKLHASIGASTLRGSISPMLQMAEEIAACHHERWDGTGYPKGLAQHDIPESARIIAIVDVYDALTRARVYRPAMTEEEALAILRDGRGCHFDPQLLDLFLELLPEMRWVASENPDQQIDEVQFQMWAEAAAGTGVAVTAGSV